jgi:penicillin-binding protein 1C
MKPARALKLALAVCAGATTLAAGVAGAGYMWWRSLGPIPLERAADVSRIVVDRDGRLLRPYVTEAGLWRLPVETGEVDPRFFALLTAYEDRRFQQHRGVDPLAMRAPPGSSSPPAAHRLRRLDAHHAGRPPHRASARTAAPWLVKAARDGPRRAARARTRQGGHARLYLSLAPYGGNVEGIRAASLAYFGKEPRRLSLGEAALLVALPQSPEARRPDRRPEAARAGARPRARPHAARRRAEAAEQVASGKAERVPSRAGRCRCLRRTLAGRLAEREAAPNAGPPHHLSTARPAGRARDAGCASASRASARGSLPPSSSSRTPRARCAPRVGSADLPRPERQPAPST